MRLVRTSMLVLLRQSAAGHAELITVDSPVGPATAVLDTNANLEWANLEWLKLSVTQNRSINQVLAQTATGERLDTFAYATLAQLCGLTIMNIQLSCAGARTEDTDPVLAFFKLFDGPLFRVDDGFGSFLRIDPPDAINRLGMNTAFRFFEGPPVPYIDTDSQAITMNERTLSEPAFHWLVRDRQSVPEPATMMLVVMGAMMLASFAGRTRFGRTIKRGPLC
jgi:hypothetical protein